jgi:hypothetical protein
VVGDLAPLDDRASDALRAERLLAAPAESSAPVPSRARAAAGAIVRARRRRRARVVAVDMAEGGR